eukprot:Tbor_TRINITY_DN943_c0_g1::TRINITY_DN943_c0_g1_i1::g.21148::m.21148/K01299/E3.4.17.19; carboxypeptidase Taq
MTHSYHKITQIFTRIHNLRHMEAIGAWDASTNMPIGSSAARGEALAELSVVIHSMFTDPRLKELIDAATANKASLGLVEQANLREINFQWEMENKQGAEFVEKLAKAKNTCEVAWRSCRKENDWNKFKPYMEEVVSLTREKAELLAKGTNLSLYEALMSEYEPGASEAEVTKLFDDLKTWLPDLVVAVCAKQNEENQKSPVVKPEGPFAIEKQEKLVKEVIMSTWQFDKTRGRLDVSDHPFCGGVPEDVRITTRYQVDDFYDSLLGVIHETGHAKYEQNRPSDIITQPVSAARSMAIHESQSLFAEMQIGRSKAFMEFLCPKLKEYFGDQPAFYPENMSRVVQTVERGLIRVDADEVTYPLHVLLRFEIEKGLIDGSIQVEDLPNAWSERMIKYLNIDTTGDYKNGLLQDIHWPMGSIGYFPTYTMGAMYAAQFMAKCRDVIGEEEVDECIRKGELGPILEWQRENIWKHGSIYETSELCKMATGSVLDVSFFRRHLEKRYLGKQ